ncbi:MAG: flagellin [Pseudomonadota bacterium]
MSSILTNSSAQVALETLRNINRNLEGIQSEISTGKKVATAKDNAAIFAISTVIDSDVQSFAQVQDSLNLGSATVGLARSASEQVVDQVREIRNLIVSAQEENVDRTSIQRDIAERVEQVETIVGGASFNGLNLINGSSSDPVNVLASLDRNAAGTDTTARFIEVDRRDLSLSNSGAAQIFGAGGDITGAALTGTGGAIAAGGDSTITISQVEDGSSFQIVIDDTATDNAIGQRTFQFVAGTADSAESVAANLASQVNSFLDATGETDFRVARNGADLVFSNATGGDVTVTGSAQSGGTAGVATGGLGGLSSIDVTSNAGATSALAGIDEILNLAIDAAASFGSSQQRIEAQTDFVQSLSDSLTTGVGALRDADIEAASARLQALQVQQQLGTQALSIANQQPQQLLALFR